MDCAKTAAAKEPDPSKGEAQSNAAKRKELQASRDAIKRMGLGQDALQAALADIDSKLAQLPEDTDPHKMGTRLQAAAKKARQATEAVKTAEGQVEDALKAVEAAQHLLAQAKERLEERKTQAAEAEELLDNTRRQVHLPDQDQPDVLGQLAEFVSGLADGDTVDEELAFQKYCEDERKADRTPLQRSKWAMRRLLGQMTARIADMREANAAQDQQQQAKGDRSASVRTAEAAGAGEPPSKKRAVAEAGAGVPLDTPPGLQ